MSRPNCPKCGRFMMRLKLISRVRIECNGGGERTHICPLEEYDYASNTWTHYRNMEELKAEEQRQLAKDMEYLRRKYGDGNSVSGDADEGVEVPENDAESAGQQG